MFGAIKNLLYLISDKLSNDAFTSFNICIKIRFFLCAQIDIPQ